eukprot:4605455-Pleurochrysis_carterae.AAC.1
MASFYNSDSGSIDLDTLEHGAAALNNIILPCRSECQSVLYSWQQLRPTTTMQAVKAHRIHLRRQHHISLLRHLQRRQRINVVATLSNQMSTASERGSDRVELATVARIWQRFKTCIVVQQNCCKSPCPSNGACIDVMAFTLAALKHFAFITIFGEPALAGKMQKEGNHIATQTWFRLIFDFLLCSRLIIVRSRL